MKYLIPLILVILVIRYFLRKKKAAPVMKPEPEVLKQDPVCGAYVREQEDLSLRTEEGVIYFCSDACMEKFKELKR